MGSDEAKLWGIFVLAVVPVVGIGLAFERIWFPREPWLRITTGCEACAACEGFEKRSAMNHRCPECDEYCSCEAGQREVGDCEHECVFPLESPDGQEEEQEDPQS
ncbi:MAG: hypothetical protein ACYTAN_12700 [Planctomycetota bacterium]|jgi:hypothetical protein